MGLMGLSTGLSGGLTPGLSNRGTRDEAVPFQVAGPIEHLELFGPVPDPYATQSTFAACNTSLCHLARSVLGHIVHPFFAPAQAGHERALAVDT
jgi:hypothetical protein